MKSEKDESLNEANYEKVRNLCKSKSKKSKKVKGFHLEIF